MVYIKLITHKINFIYYDNHYYIGYHNIIVYFMDLIILFIPLLAILKQELSDSTNTCHKYIKFEKYFIYESNNSFMLLFFFEKCLRCRRRAKARTTLCAVINKVEIFI